MKQYLSSPSARVLKKSGRGRQCTELKMKLSMWSESITKYWNVRNKQYAVSDEAKQLIMEGQSLLQTGLQEDLNGQYCTASSNYRDGMERWDSALTMVPTGGTVAMLLADHRSAFGKRKDEIEFLFAQEAK